MRARMRTARPHKAYLVQPGLQPCGRIQVAAKRKPKRRSALRFATARCRSPFWCLLVVLFLVCSTAHVKRILGRAVRALSSSLRQQGRASAHTVRRVYCSVCRRTVAALAVAMVVVVLVLVLVVVLVAGQSGT